MEIDRVVKLQVSQKYQLINKGAPKKNIWKSIIGVKIRYGVMVILRLLSEMLVKKQPNITYGIGVEVDAYIP